MTASSVFKPEGKDGNMKTILVVSVLSLLNLGGLFFGLAAAAEPLRLDGTLGWIADSNILLDLEEAVTLEAWVRPEIVDKGGARIIEKANAYMLDTAPGIALRMSVAAGSISCEGNLPTNRLSHVVGVFSRAQGIYKLYVDGKEKASQGREAMRRLSVTPLPLKVCSDSSGRNCFCGDVARVTIYNRALDAAEIAGLAADETHKSHGLPGTVADWFFTRKDASECISDAPGRLRLCDRPGATHGPSPAAGESRQDFLVSPAGPRLDRSHAAG
jgi:hypothetical protein